MTYKKMFVAFLDILGFSAMIKKSESDPAVLSNIEDVLTFIRDEKEDNDHGILALKNTGKRITTFSDSIVITYDADCKGAGYYMLTDISYLMIGLLSYGIVIRGALSYGDMIHDDLRCYGPTLVRAYELESESAVYPRILVDSNVVKAALENPYNTKKDEAKYIAPLIKNDAGEYSYIDFLNVPFDDDDERYLAISETIRISKQGIIDNYAIDNVRCKYEWLKAYSESKLK